MKKVTREKKQKAKRSERYSNTQNGSLSQKGSFPFLASALSGEELEEEKSTIEKSIKEHLFRFGGSSPTLNDDYSNSFVADVCNYAKEYLANIYYPKAKNLYKYWMAAAQKDDSLCDDNCPLLSKMIQVEWLANIPLLLPCEQIVFNALPFLLMCYTINMPHNRLDPKDQPSGSAAPGWCEIFSKVSSDQRKDLQTFGGSNRSKNIQSLSSYFVIASQSRDGITRYNEDLFFHKGSKKSTSADRRIFLDFWENYHRFILFCMACKKAQEQRMPPQMTHTPHIFINYTLSMALFSSIWKFHDIQKPLYKSIEVKNDPLKSKIFDLIKSEEMQSKDSIGADSLFFKIADCLPKDYNDENVLFSELYDSHYPDF